MIPIHWKVEAKNPTIISPTHTIELNLPSNKIEIKSRLDSERHTIEFRDGKVIAKSRQSGSKTFEGMTLQFQRALKDSVVQAVLAADRVHSEPRAHMALITEIHKKWTP